MPVLYWVLLGGACLVIEVMVVPMFIIVYFGLAAWLVALLLSLGIITSISLQWIIFAVASIVLLLSTRALFRRWLTGNSTQRHEKQGSFNAISENTFAKVLEEFEQGNGVVEWRGARWKAQLERTVADNVPTVGQQVKVLAQKNLTLTVTNQF